MWFVGGIGFLNPSFDCVGAVIFASFISYERISGEKSANGVRIVCVECLKKRRKVGGSSIFMGSSDCFGSLDCRNGSPVDDNFSAVDVGSAVGYQESNKLGDFFGSTGATNRDASERIHQTLPGSIKVCSCIGG